VVICGRACALSWPTEEGAAILGQGRLRVGRFEADASLARRSGHQRGRARFVHSHAECSDLPHVRRSTSSGWRIRRQQASHQQWDLGEPRLDGFELGALAGDEGQDL
jgi:hypothetical protein